MELADTTVWSWSRRKAYPELREWFDDALIEGEIAICDMVRLDYSTACATSTSSAP